MNLLSQIERDEGFRQFPYADSVGVWTIGIGRNLESNGVSLEEARYLAQNDIEKITAALRQRLHWFDTHSECRQAVLINMAFNMGIGGLLGFKKLIAALEVGDYQIAAEEMLNSKWAKQVGVRAERLAKQMTTNEWM